MRTYLRLLGFLRPYLGRFAGALGCMVLLAAATGLYGYLVGPVLKFLFTGGASGGEQIVAIVPFLEVSGADREAMLVLLPLVIVFVAAVKGFAYYGQAALMGGLGQRVVYDVRATMCDHLLTLPQSFFHRSKSGDLVSRFVSDAGQIEEAVTFGLSSYLRDSLQIATLLGLCFWLDWELALVSFLVFPLAAFPLYKFGRRVRAWVGRGQEALGEIGTAVHESVAGIRDVQVFGREDAERERFGRANRHYLATMLRSLRVKAVQSPVVELLGALGLAATLWWATSRVARGDLAPEHFVSFFATVLLLYQPVKMLGRVNTIVFGGIAAADRIFALLDTRSEIRDRVGARPLPRFAHGIELRRVHFSYGHGPVLRGIDLSIRAGEVVALVGPSGGGKTTLLSLVPRLYDVQEGAVLVDGHDVREVSLASLRAQIAVVGQEPFLFNDTVHANIAYGRPGATTAEVEEAARAAHAREFIERLPQRYETVVGERGVRLSGGERQRIAIARAILKDAPILILDEATSHLDAESERLVQEALEALMRGRTVLVIAHRLSTIRRAERIVFVAQGQVAEVGTHAELLQRPGAYRRFYELQFGQGAA
jgi:subfamily B ATP-binding cassette protein MsbA